MAPVLPPRAQGLTPVAAHEEAELLTFLGEAPFTAGVLGYVKRGLCRAYLSDVGGSRVAVIHVWDSLTEPSAYGEDPHQIWELLARIPGWDCVNVGVELVPELSSLMEEKTGQTVTTLADYYYTLTRDPIPLFRPTVRLLDPKDLNVASAAERVVEVAGHGDVATTLREGVTAAAVERGNIVSRVMTTPWASPFVNLAAGTLPDWRGRGLARAATHLVCRELRPRGLVPTWSTGETNSASRRVAESVGFTLYGKRAYIVVEGLRPAGWQPQS